MNYQPSELDRVVYADQFGATPDDGLDQTDHITAALSHAETTGRPLVIPPGTYLCGQLQIPAGVHVSGLPGAVLKRSTATGAVVNMAAGSTLESITVDGNSALGTSGTNGEVQTNDDDVTIRNVTVVDPFVFGIRGYGGPSNLVIENCKVFSSNTRAAIIYSGGAAAPGVGFTVRDCFIDKTGGTDGAGIHVGLTSGTGVGLSWVDISGNTVTGVPQTAICIEVFCAPAVEATDMAIVDNLCSGGVMGVSVPRARRATIADNVLANATTFGVEIVDAVDVSCTGNVMSFNPATAATGVTTNMSENVSIIGNVIRDAKSAAIGTNDSSGVTPPRNVVIQGNVIENCDTGVKVWNGGSGFVVAGNVIDTAVSYGIYYGTSAGTSVNCQGNTIRNAPVGIRFNNPITYTGSVVGNVMDDNVTTKISITGAAIVTGLRRVANTGVADV